MEKKFEWGVGVAAVEALVILYLALSLLYIPQPIRPVHHYEITPSYFEPSFVCIYFDDVPIMGGMWAVVNNTRSIDIKNFDPDPDGVYSEIICMKNNELRLVTHWGFANRTAYWHIEENEIEVDIEWRFDGFVYIEKLIEPYWEFAGAQLYTPEATIRAWSQWESYMYSYQTVPQEHYIENLEGVYLDYVPLFDDFGVRVMFGCPCMYVYNKYSYLGLDDEHGCDFYRMFYNTTWSGIVNFKYSISIGGWYDEW